METISTPAVWAGFVLFVLLSMAVDLGLHRRSNRGMTTRAALLWTAAWIVMALAFCAGLWHLAGRTAAAEFLAGYLLEKSLSVDNLFVFVLVFAHFRTPAQQQHRVLVWGIVGAMILRAVMILLGAVFVHKFEPVLALFALILFWSGYKLLFEGDDDKDPSKGLIVRLARRTLPLVERYDGKHFFVVEDGRRKCTMLFLVLVVIEGSDVLFAVDSIPAIFGVTRDPFIVFTSNVFAILGLRAMFFVIAAAIQRLEYLNKGLAFVLCFIGLKLMLPFIDQLSTSQFGVDLKISWLLDEDAQGRIKVSTGQSLAVIVGALGLATAYSLWKSSGRPEARAEAPLVSHVSDRLPKLAEGAATGDAGAAGPTAGPAVAAPAPAPDAAPPPEEPRP